MQYNDASLPQISYTNTAAPIFVSLSLCLESLTLENSSDKRYSLGTAGQGIKSAFRQQGTKDSCQQACLESDPTVPVKPSDDCTPT